MLLLRSMFHVSLLSEVPRGRTAGSVGLASVLPVKFIVNKEALLSALGPPSRVTGTAVMSCLRLKLEGDELSVLGTNRETWIETRVEVEGGGDGEALLAAKVLIPIVKSFESGPVRIDCSGDQESRFTESKDLAVLSSGGSEFTLAIWIGELPVLDDKGMGKPFDLDPAQSGAVFEQVAMAAGTDEHRQTLMGVHVEADGSGQAEMAATDSYRLSLRELPSLSDAVSGSSDPLVPAAALREAAKAMADAESAQARVGERSVEFTVGNTTVASTLIVGDFPSYRNLIPNEFNHKVSVSRGELMKATKQAGVIANQGERPVVLDIGDGVITVSAEMTDVGNMSAEIDASHDGEPLKVAFNPKYLMEGLDSFDCDEVLLCLIDRLKPATIRDPDAEGGLYLLMPVRVND